MSMIGNLVAVHPSLLAAFIADPGQIEEFLYPEDESDPPNFVDLDKAWDAIQFILDAACGEEDGPLTLAVLGGASLDEDIGYGPVRYLNTEQVAAVAAALAGVPDEEFRRRFDPAALDAAESTRRCGWSLEPRVWSTWRSIMRC